MELSNRSDRGPRISGVADLYRILSIDGGGIRGIIPARILMAVEEKLQQETGNEDARIADYFDLIAGTSTGGILGCVYLCPSSDQPTRPRFTASQALELYFERGDEIFDIPLGHKIRSAAGLLDERYPAEGLEEALHDYLGQLKLSALLKPCLITAYDVRRRRAHFFKQHLAQEDPNRNFLVRDVARATSAAPTYFECARVKSDANLVFPLIDGGVFANNPALCAYAEARVHADKRAADMVILSLGSGSNEKSYAYAEAKDWGLAEWAKPVISIMMSGVAETVDYQFEQIFDAVGRPEQYLRVQPEIPVGNSDLDRVDQENLNELRQLGADAAGEFDAKLSDVVKLLLQGA